MNITAEQAAKLLDGTTPGPWYVGAQNDALYVIDAPPSPAPYDGPIPKDYGPNVICTPAWRDMPLEANATLIAAAPDLARALIASEAARKLAEERLREEWNGLMRAAHDNHEANNRAEKAEAERDAALAQVEKLLEAGLGLKSIVEGLQGAMEHGTWRAERSNLRMKDTEEWVTFYNVLAALEEDVRDAKG